MIPLTILPAPPIICLLMLKAPYLLGATTAFRVAMKSVPHCFFLFSLLLVLDESTTHRIWPISIYVFIINLNT